MVAITLRYKDRLFYQQLQSGKTVTFGSGANDSVRVADMVENQLSVVEMHEQLSIRSKAPFQCSRDNLPIGSMISIDDQARLFSSRTTGMYAQRVKLPFNGIVNVGRSESNDLVIALPFVSGKHFALRIVNGVVRAEDLNSTHKLYLNGMQIQSGVLKSGDVLNILTIRIHLVNNELQIENAGNNVRMARFLQNSQPAPAAQPKPAAQAKPVQSAPAAQAKPAQSAPKQKVDYSHKQLRFRLSPRIQDQLPQETIVLDRPPKKGQEYHPRSNRIASVLSMGAMGVTGLAMGAVSPVLAFARAASLVANVVNMVSSSKIDKQRQAEMEEYNRRRDKEYRTYIEAQRARIVAVANEQRRIISDENPAPEKCLQMVEKLDRRIWERMSTDRDFLDVRLGMGYEDLCVPIKNYAENRGLMMEDDELEELCNAIAEENQIVDQVPARIRLRTTPTIGLLGNRDSVIHQVRNMLVSLTTLHSHEDVQIVGIFDGSERSRWASLRWLPHVWDNNRQFRYLAYDAERAHNLCEMLHDILKRRLEKSQDAFGKKSAAPTPHYVVILGNRSMVQREPVMELLTSNNPDLGVTTLFMFDTLGELPQQCSHFIDLDGKYPTTFGKLNGNQRSAFSRDPSVSATQFGSFARRLAAINLENDRLSNALPGSLTFLEGMGVQMVEELRILDRWKANTVRNTLRAPIGVLANGKPFYLDNHYTGHGAHGLLAGTTGSGKSELLRTWILSMAVNYHPHQVCFVIIDYKGGGMANKLEALPHVIGKITNIDSNITRSLVSLKREAKRRMEMLEASRVDNIEDYLQLYHSGKVREPMPHLMIVSDEFAELKREEPEFLKELTSLARVGRSVGIHLMLATQRPSGVVDDQINSNTNFRICMKVSTAQDSKEMIKRPDAAALTQRGRAYIRVGEDEMLELFQSYWSGAAYSGSQSTAAQFTNQVSVVDVSGERIQNNAADSGMEKGETQDQLTVIVRHICEQAQMARISKLSGCWQPELPEILPMQQLAAPKGFNGTGWSSECEWLKVPMGLYDLPSRQAQGVQYMDFGARPHYGVYGGPSSGKTTLLKTLILSLGMQFSPADVNMYVLDFGGGSLSAYAGMPHVGMVIKEDDEENLKKFVAKLQTEIRSRKLTFSKAKVSNFDAYRQRKQDMPAIFVLIDNLQRLTTIYNKIQIEQTLIEISMTGPDTGVHLVFTDSNINKISMNLRTNIGGNIALHLTDHNDYKTAIDAFPEGSREPVNPGRAVIRDTGVAEFQTAIFLAASDAAKNSAALDQLIRQMQNSWQGPAVGVVKAAPENLTLEELAGHYTARDVLPMGLDRETLEPVHLDLSGDKHYMLISAMEEKDAVSAMQAMAKLLMTKKDNKVYVLDPGKKLSALQNRVAMYADDATKMNMLVEHLCAEMTGREDAYYDQADGDQSVNQSSFALNYNQICLLIESPHLVMKDLSSEHRKLLLGMCSTTAQLGAIYIASGTVDDLGQYAVTEPLTVLFADYPESGDGDGADNRQLGFCLGGSIKQHDCFAQKQLPSEVRSAKIAGGDGVVFDRGKAVLIKRVQG